jgi:hypothetical protein
MNATVVHADILVWILASMSAGVLLGAAAFALLWWLWRTAWSSRSGAASPVASTDVNVGRLIKLEAISRLDELIALGLRLDGSKFSLTDSYCTQVQMFVHYLNLPRDTNFEGQAYSAIERDIVWVFSDVAGRGQNARSNGEKLIHVISGLQGLRAGLAATAY